MQVTTKGRVLIIEENSFVPVDVRVWYEATSLRDAGWQVFVICPTAKGAHAGTGGSGTTPNPDNIDGITVYRFPLIYAEHGAVGYLKEYISAFGSIARLSWRVWSAGRFQVIHFCNPPDIFFLIALFYRLQGTRVVFDHHDLFPETVEMRFYGLLGRLLYFLARVSEYLTFRSADIVISTNESYRRLALERGGLSPDRVIVVRNGPKISEFVPVTPVPPLKRGFPYMACYAGVMGYQDGVSELIAAIQNIVQELGRHDILFALLGDGAARRQAMADVHAYGLERFVVMPGFIRDNLLLRQYLCTADVCLSPEPPTRLNSCSTLVKIAEYMAMGRAIVSFDLEETRFTASDAAVYVSSGSIHEFGRTVVDLIDDPERRARMGEFGRDRVLQCLGWEHQRQYLLKAYTTAVAEDKKK